MFIFFTEILKIITTITLKKAWINFYSDFFLCFYNNIASYVLWENETHFPKRYQFYTHLITHFQVWWNIIAKITIENVFRMIVQSRVTTMSTYARILLLFLPVTVVCVVAAVAADFRNRIEVLTFARAAHCQRPRRRSSQETTLPPVSYCHRDEELFSDSSAAEGVYVYNDVVGPISVINSGRSLRCAPRIYIYIIWWRQGWPYTHVVLRAASVSIRNRIVCCGEKTWRRCDGRTPTCSDRWRVTCKKN